MACWSNKLPPCGVSGQFLSLVQSFLKDRKQRTFLNGQCSNWRDVLAGVSRGSILKPLFFLVYIGDLTADLKCHVKLFTDDKALFTVIQEPNAAAENINHDLELISIWANDRRMSFNADPKKQAFEPLFSKTRHEIDHPVILCYDTPKKK